MSKIQAVPFVESVLNSMTLDLKTDLTNLINGGTLTPTFKTLYTIGESDIDKAQFVTLETKGDTFTGYLVYNDDYCVLFAFSPNSQDLAMVNIDVTNKTCELVKEQLNILELRMELEDSKVDTDVDELLEEVEDIKEDVADIIDGTTHLFENITDRNGNKRFVEGDITMETIDGVTQTYGKWSLSGSHLMIVVAGSIASGTIVTTSTSFAKVTLPAWVHAKLLPIIQDGVSVCYFNDGFYAIDNSQQSCVFRLSKRANQDYVGIDSISNVTMNTTRAFRIHFDLLIDDEYE